jgi:hypothetical protein
LGENLKSEEVVEISSNDRGSRKSLRGHFFRMAGPIGFVVVMLAALLAITAYSYYSNRRDALAMRWPCRMICWGSSNGVSPES